MTCLSVNLNKVAWLRNSRDGDRPSLVEAARIVLAAGAHGLTVHPRPDQRHVRTADVAALADLLKGYPGIEFNIEGNPVAPPIGGGYPGLLALVAAALPAQVTLVPDGDAQLTSDHGWNLARDGATVAPLVARLHALGCRVSLFMDPEPDDMARARDVGADRIELYTGPYAASCDGEGVPDGPLLDRYARAAAAARAAGLGVNAGHDLDRRNLPALLGACRIDEVSIGHALIADALVEGLGPVVGDYLAVLRSTA